MHKLQKRFSFVFYGLFNPTLILLASIFILSLLYDKKELTTDIKVHSVETSGRRRILRFSPNIDLTPQFNFNVKQIFFYLRVVYPTGSSEILWSEIVKRSDSKVFTKLVHSNYEIRGEVGVNAVLELRGCVFPFVGMIKDKLYGKRNFVL